MLVLSSLVQPQPEVHGLHGDSQAIDARSRKVSSAGPAKHQVTLSGFAEDYQGRDMKLVMANFNNDRITT